jgi:alpha-1,6-mannosyltransferase
MRIVRLANFYAPTSGGQRTALDETGQRYRRRGIEPILVVPGPEDDDVMTPSGRRITLRSPHLPRTPYHLLTDLDRVRSRLADLQPDRIELSDRSTLWPLARWAREERVPLVLWVHERVESMLAARLPGFVPVATAGRALERRSLRDVDRAVTPSEFAAAPIRAAGVRDVRVVPHGVDLRMFHPARRPPTLGRRPLLVWVGRLSAEKLPQLAIDTLRELVARRRPVHLLVIGDGGQAATLRRRAADLPVTFGGHLANREGLAHLVAVADVALATCPGESFGLSALEALAAGTPVVAADTGGLVEVVDRSAGRLAAPSATAFADAVEDLLDVPEQVRRHLARRRAERFSWDATVDGLLDAHGLVETTLERTA